MSGQESVSCGTCGVPFWTDMEALSRVGFDCSFATDGPTEIRALHTGEVLHRCADNTDFSTSAAFGLKIGKA